MAGVGAKAEVCAEKCTGCARCVKRCPFGAITLDSERAVVEESRCIGCMRCLRVCPASAIIAQKIEH
ncbi:MAG: 4Fe-4S dicluster domain-containing protein [Fretibacterium sp.]|nr:4Fe-4S dicluster domain-containing protein [Fretibacterium sp.]